MESDAVAIARDLIAAGVPVHMSGVGGVGMAGLALLLQARGVPVSGCDLQAGSFTPGLMERGIAFCIGHAAAQAEAPVGWVIRSTAVRADRPDVVRANERGIPVLQRGAVLAALVGAHVQSVAIAGTHGKTTTSTLVAELLKPLDPSWCIGGVSRAYPVPGGSGVGPLVVEADESDGTLALYAAHVAVVTNVDFDHMEHFASVAAFEACFQTFLAQAREHVIFCADDARAALLGQSCGQRALGYGFGATADVRGIWTGPRTLQVEFPAGKPERVVLPDGLPGRHNALNLMGALAACHALGVPSSVWSAAIAELSLPARRFETLAVCGGIRVVTDYAHHPAEIVVLLRMARELHAGRIVMVFQPHRYSRTVALRSAFPQAFRGVDRLVLVPVYAASEQPLAGGAAEDIWREIEVSGVACDAVLAGTLEEAADLVLREVAAGDLVLVVGAGDVERTGRIVADAIRSLNGSG